MERIFDFSKITWDQIVLILGKIGTGLVDRRFLEAVGVVLFMLFGIPEGKYTNEITQIGTFVLSLAVMLSWTVRPPSGLKHKDLVDFGVVKQVASFLNSTYEQK